MKKSFFIVLAIAIFTFIFYLFPNQCDFEESYSRYGKSDLEKFLTNEAYQKKYNIGKALYNTNFNKKTKIHGNIPKIIHQIWLGKPMPDVLIPLIEKWKNLEDWEYMLWSEEDILKLDFENKDLYLQSNNYGEKTDIARLEILKLFGGIYVDTDYEYTNIKNLEKFIDLYDIILGFEPLEHKFTIGNAFIAVSPNHPFLEKVIQEIRPNFFNNYFEIAMYKTGPYFMTDKIFENIDLLKGGIILPPTYLYPLNAWHKEFKELNSNWDEYIKEETIGIHYWTSLWANFKRIENASFRDKKD